MNNEENKTITATSKELEGLEELSNEDLEEVSGGNPPAPSQSILGHVTDFVGDVFGHVAA